MAAYIYGYVRVSTRQQELNRLKDKLRPGDMVVVASFSRLGRNTNDLIELVVENNVLSAGVQRGKFLESYI